MNDDDKTRTLSRSGADGPDVAASDAFVPGAVISARYRLVALLGRGGMGEVYRADDLTLDQPVALKFLPVHVAADRERLAQFHNELRIARQVSHKNVCRLYDLGEADGRPFITMEYVDGEDLASLLRRIGRVPEDRAVQMARQLCAAVAAAHERGVIHRDLKPANVMIDGDGNVRVTDFGIATPAGRSDGAVVGTPQYMAPEQLAGGLATVKSDLYALGLILFELFTGRRAIESRTLADLKEFHHSGTIATPSSIVRDLDRAVERVILRCLDRDPARRPASALAVAAALPGGDPLAAALAAGETPSPEILAAAGETEALGLGRALALVAAIFAGSFVFAALSSRTSTVGRTPLDDPPAVLVDRAEQLIAKLGHPAVSATDDVAFGFIRFQEYIQWLRSQQLGPERWEVLADGDPSAVLFWYRTSPRELVPLEDAAVTLSDPPPAEAGMRSVVLDPRGRLQRFRSVPPPLDEAGHRAQIPDWDGLFEAAGLSKATFAETSPQWTPSDYADLRAAWEGPHPHKDDLRLRIEAAAYAGRPMFFEVIGPWTRPEALASARMSAIDRLIVGGFVVGGIGLIVAASVLARRHLRSNRADRRGAARLTVYVTVAASIAWILRADHSWSLEGELDALFRAAGDLSVIAIVLWIVYIALEPYVRKLWPDVLLGWSRLLAGHLRDPRVGSDLLVGMAAGVTLALIDLAKATLVPALGFSAPYARYGFAAEALGVGAAAGWMWLLQSVGAIGEALFTVLLIVILRLTLRLRWLAVTVVVLILSVTSFYDITALWTTVFPLTSGVLLTVVALKFGLLSLVVARCVWGMLGAVPLTLEVWRWHATPSNWTLAGIVALTCFGFYASRAGQPLFGSVLKE